MKTLVVKLWDKELGILVHEPEKNLIYFMFNPALHERPDVAPLTNPKTQWNPNLPVYGQSGRVYQGLPPFIADSLPDAWGNRLFDQWVKKNRIPRHRITPLYKLMFIGKRGMGALEFEPAAHELELSQAVDIKNLYNLSLDILADRQSVALNILNGPTLQTLLAVGTSAGGRQMKAIVAIDSATGTIRSGQTECPAEYEYYIVKFGEPGIPLAEIEVICYEMATEAGIDMEKCSLLKVEDTNHFLTKRFDRKNGKKIHVQTLAALNPNATSYEDLMETARKLNLSESELREIFRRMIFNVMLNNTDDHNKNFSFLLEENSEWHIAPAYDITFIFNRYATGPQPERCMSLYGKITDITLEDLKYFAKDNGIQNAGTVITKVAKALMKFPQLADKYALSSTWRHIIQTTLHNNLIRFGFINTPATSVTQYDLYGRKIENINVSVNAKGLFELSLFLDGKRRRKFFRPDTEQGQIIHFYNLHKETDKQIVRLIEEMFPPEIQD